MIDDNVRTYKLGLPRNCRMIMFKHYSTEVLKVKIQFPGRNLFGTLLALNRKKNRARFHQVCDKSCKLCSPTSRDVVAI